MEILARSRIFKKLLLSVFLFLALIIAVNIIINFQIKKIRNGINETNSLISLNSDKLSEVIGAKRIENRVKKIEEDFGLNLIDLKKKLNEKIKQPNLAEISAVFQTISRKYQSQAILSQDESGDIKGEWRGSVNGFGEALKSLKSAHMALKFNTIEIRPDKNFGTQESETGATSTSNQSKNTELPKKFIIKFTISII